MKTVEKDIPHYSQLIFNEFKKRCDRNRLYSLRSFARDLEISPSFLSKLLRKEISCSVSKAGSIAKKLNWSEQNINFFLLIVNYFNCPNKGNLKTVLGNQIQQQLNASEHSYHKLSVSHENLLEDWFIIGLLELIPVEGFNSDPSWISHRLGISENNVKHAIKTLQLLGMIHSNENKLIRSHSRYWIGDFSSKQIQEYHLRNLKLAARALKKQSMNERDFSSSIVAISKEKIPKIKEIIKEFHQNILNIQNEQKPNCLYKIDIQLFRLDQDVIKIYGSKMEKLVNEE